MKLASQGVKKTHWKCGPGSKGSLQLELEHQEPNPDLLYVPIPALMYVNDWPAKSLAPNPARNQYQSIVKRKMRAIRANNGEVLKVTISATWTSTTLQQNHMQSASMPRCNDAVTHAKGIPTKYWEHKLQSTWAHSSAGQHFLY